MKKFFFSITILFIVTSLLISGCTGQSDTTPAASSTKNSSSEREKTVFKVGISQFVEHPALDSARLGFIDGLKEAGFEEGKNLNILLENAQADFPTTQTIANKLVSEKVDLILAIATPSAQSVAKATKDIPILITAVTDPVEAGLVQSLEEPGGNVTGTTDMNPIKEQLELLLEIIPQAKKIGVIYNAAEPNSVVQINIVKEVSKTLGLDVLEATVASSSEVNQAVQSLTGKVDAIYTPTDNTVVSAIGAVVKVANDSKIPIIGAERGHVDGGVLATLGIDYYLLGKQTGHMAARILKGEEPSQIPVEDSKDLKLIINKKSAQILQIKIPEQILSRADEVVEK